MTQRQDDTPTRPTPIAAADLDGFRKDPRDGARFTALRHALRAGGQGELLAEVYSDNGGWFTWGNAESPDFSDVPDGANGVFVTDGGFDQFGNRTRASGSAAWLWSLGSMVLLASCLFLLGCRRLRTPAENER